jgi:hypothetical protein
MAITIPNKSISLGTAFGSLADITPTSCNVRFAPESGLSVALSGCLLSANSGHRAGPPLARPQRGEGKIKFAYDARGFKPQSGITME